MRIVVLAAMAALLAGPARADDVMTFDPPGPYDVDVSRTVRYAAPSADTMILCRPVMKGGGTDAWTGPRPAVLLIHGGGWDGGTNDIGHGEYTGYSGSWCRLAASWGLVTFSVGYRLQDGSRSHAWPAAFVDVQAAVRYVRAHAGALGVDPRMIAAWGDSAGGSLALQLGATPAVVAGDLAADNPGASPRVEAVVDAFGPWTWGPSSDAAPSPAVAAQHEAAASGGRSLPPTLIIQGQGDRIVPPEQSRAAYCFLADHAASVHYLSYPYDHEYSGWDGPEWSALVGRLQLQAISFLFAVGHGPAGAPAPVIPATIAGPALPFEGDARPHCP